MVYLFPILLTLLLIYHYDYRGHKKGRIVWYIVLLIYCILVAGLRYRIGSDTIVYMTRHFDRLPTLSEYFSYDFTNERFGRGFVFLVSIARSTSNSFVVLQLILSIFLNTVVFRFIYRNTNNVFTAVLFYFILSYINLNMEVLRESCAVGIFLIGWPYFYKHQWIKYYICCCIALLFHTSAAFTFILPVFTLPIFKRVFNFSWISVGIALGLYVIGIIISSYFFDAIRLIGIATLDDYAQSYEGSSFGQGHSFNMIGTLVFIIKYIVYPFFIVWLYSRGKKCKNASDERYKSSLLIMMIMFIFVGVFSFSVFIIQRFTNYLFLFLILGFADTVFNRIYVLKKIYRLSYMVWFVILFPYSYIYFHAYSESIGNTSTKLKTKYYPYYSVLNPQLDREREKLLFYYIRK